MTIRRATLDGIKFISKFEGFSPTIYICPAGWKTIGYGHALKKGEEELFKEPITPETALEILRKDVEEAERAVSRLIVSPLHDYQFDALVSFTFNLGSGALQRSTLRSMLNRGEYVDAANEFPKWSYAGGRWLKGLYRRRVAEQQMFLYGIYE